MKSFIAQSGQSINDLAYMAYGDFMAIFDLKKENPTININNNNFAGITINYTPKTNQIFANQALTNRVIATGWQNNIEKSYLITENDFYFDLEDNSGKIELEN